MKLMNYNLFYILLFIFGIASAQEKYYISRNKTTAGDAAGECELASPLIIYSKDDNTVDMNTTEILDTGGFLETMGTYWIGYTEELVYFLYKGCALPSDLNSTKHSNLTKDPGQCYSKCQRNFIGIQETTCHCISSQPADAFLHMSGCNSSCTSPAGVLCGSQDYVSVYVKVHPFSGYFYPNCSCISYDYGNFKRQTCSDELLFQCQTGTVYFCFPPSWDEAMQRCLCLQSQDAFISSTLSKSWAAGIRSYSIDNIREMSFNTYDLLAGIVELKNGRLHLKFEQPNGDLKMHSICKIQTSPSQPTTGPRPPSPALSTGLSLSTDSALPTGSTSSTSSESTKIALYTVLPVSLVVLAAVLVFIVWRRRILKACKYTDSGICRKASSTTANPVLEGKPQSEAFQHDYIVLEPLGQYVSVKEDYKQDTNEDNYDKATGFPQKHDTVNGNYDRATRFASRYDTYEDTYDQATRFTDNHRTNESNYDRVVGYTNRLDEGSDDYDNPTNSSLDNLGSYDHIGDIKRATAKSDDYYNHLETQKDENNTYDTSSTFTKAIADNTYSKVTEK